MVSRFTQTLNQVFAELVHLFSPSCWPSMGLLDAFGEFFHRLFRVGRNVRAYRLRIDQEQVARRVEVK
jgi:hypothetical protein